MAHAARGRLVTTLNGLVALALVVLLAVVALVVKPPSPPGIAEFAPQASRPITKAPPGQAAQNGTGPGACAVGQRCAATPPTAVPTALSTTSTKVQGVPSALQCYQWPDGKVTQTFDPQSPPCIASWPDAAKGNGGATTRGVTKSEIRVAIRQYTLSDPDQKAYVNSVVDFFNSHYEFYGRHLRLVPAAADDAFDPSKTHASAQAFLTTDAFAAFVDGVNDPALAHELSANHMLSVQLERVNGHWATSSALSGEWPYAWIYEPPADISEHRTSRSSSARHSRPSEPASPRASSR